MKRPPDRDRLYRAWRAVEPPPLEVARGRARLLGAPKRAVDPPRARLRLRLALVAVIVVAVQVVTALVLFTRGAPAPAASSSAPPVEMWLESQEDEVPLTFSEGSRIVMSPASRGRVETLTAEGGTFRLERGAVSAHVVHRDATDWRFVAGPYEVAVTGTSLDVAWDPSAERISVHVSEGEVVVRGPDIPSSQIVRSGERCRVDGRAHTLSVELPEPAPTAKSEPSAAAPPPSTTGTARGASASPTEPWTAFEERGDYPGAFDAASRAGLPSLERASSAEELLRLAEVAQLTGHAALAREVLLACRKRFADTEPSAVAAYELGLRSGSSEAITWFETYLRERPGGPLASTAMGRLLEAQVAMGETGEARSTAQRYLDRFPKGPQAGLARRVLEGAAR